MTEITFEILGEPKGRMHTKAVFNPKTKRIFTRPVDSPPHLSWTAAVRDAAIGAMWKAKWEKIEVGAVRLGVEFVMPRPQAYYWKTPHPEPRCYRGIDLGNLTKALEDACNGVLWRDDVQIAEYGPVYLRRYAQPGETCRAVVTVRALGEWYSDEEERLRREVQQGLEFGRELVEDYRGALRRAGAELPPAPQLEGSQMELG